MQPIHPLRVLYMHIYGRVILCGACLSPNSACSQLDNQQTNTTTSCKGLSGTVPLLFLPKNATISSFNTKAQDRITTKSMAVAHTSTWLITGASSGFGKSLALEALKAGNKVIGTTRNVAKAESSCPDFSAKGGIWMGLDPANKNAYDEFAKCSQEHHVDVLVNNAGYAFIGGVEDTRSVYPRAAVPKSLTNVAAQRE